MNKGIWILLAISGIGLGLLLLRKKELAAQEPVSGTPSPSNLADNIVLAPNQAGGGSSAPPAPNIPNTINDSLAANEEVPVGFLISGLEDLQFKEERENPLFPGQMQSVFTRTEQVGPAAAIITVGGEKAFLEQVPFGAASGSPNVVEVPGEFGFHTVKSSKRGVIKPGDPDYDKALAAARKSIEDARSKSGVLDATGKRVVESKSSNPRSAESRAGAGQTVERKGRKVVIRQN